MKKPTDKQLSKYRESITTEFTNIEKLEVLTIADAMEATDIIYRAKSVAQEVEERENAIIEPLKQSLASVRELFDPIISSFKAVEKTGKEKLLEWHATQWEKGDVINTIKGSDGASTVSALKVVEITDSSKIPREYLIPDTAKIKKALVADEDVPGTQLVEDYTIRISKYE